MSSFGWVVSGGSHGEFHSGCAECGAGWRRVADLIGQIALPVLLLVSLLTPARPASAGEWGVTYSVSGS